MDDEFAWRLKEIANLKIIVRAPNLTISRDTAVRAAIPLLYGHWEGFIKNASTHYLEYINGQSLAYSELKSCFIVFGLKQKLNELEKSKNSSTSISILDFLRGELGEKSKLKIESAIRTEFNLSSKVFGNIAKSIGISTTPYESRYHLIDESLLNRRNKIAHGEYLEVGSDGFRKLADEILTLLRSYKTDIENSATLESYKKIHN